MPRRLALSLTAVLLLLATPVASTLARTQPRPVIAHHAIQAPSSLAIVESYFAALDHQGQPGHDYRTLERLYAPTITLLESLTTGSPRLHTGLGQAYAFDRANVLRWFMERSEQLSPGVILTIDQPSVRGPGHELHQAGPWLTLFTIKAGKIANLIWMPC